jgi:hypothetical protein
VPNVIRLVVTIQQFVRVEHFSRLVGSGEIFRERLRFFRHPLDYPDGALLNRAIGARCAQRRRLCGDAVERVHAKGLLQ